MTPTMAFEGQRVAPTPGFFQHPDATPVAVLDLDGDPLYQGCIADAEAFMAANGLRPHCNCELVTDRDYTVGLDPF